MRALDVVLPNPAPLALGSDHGLPPPVGHCPDRRFFLA